MRRKTVRRSCSFKGMCFYSCRELGCVVEVSLCFDVAHTTYRRIYIVGKISRKFVVGDQ